MQYEAPIVYKPEWIDPETASQMLVDLGAELAWVRHDLVPRREYFVSRKHQPYTYGQGAGVRTYQPQPTHPWIDAVWARAEVELQTSFDVCFLNGYENGSDHLGWHADDSPEMDDLRPIAIVTLHDGPMDREIWFQRKDPERRLITPDKLRLGHGSLCVMPPGMQDTHMHRIPKADFMGAGRRVSFTFRGLA